VQQQVGGRHGSSIATGIIIINIEKGADVAQILIDGATLTVVLSRWEKLAALHGDVTVPLAAVEGVRVVDEPLPAVTGLRAPGLALPGRTKIGTWRASGRRTFAVARAGVPAVCVDLSGAGYARLVVSTPDAHDVDARLQGAASR
jgi:hypothetical protein